MIPEGPCSLFGSQFFEKEKKKDGLSFRLAIEPFLKPCTFIVFVPGFIIIIESIIKINYAGGWGSGKGGTISS